MKDWSLEFGFGLIGAGLALVAIYLVPDSYHWVRKPLILLSFVLTFVFVIRTQAKLAHNWKDKS